MHGRHREEQDNSTVQQRHPPKAVEGQGQCQRAIRSLVIPRAPQNVATPALGLSMGLKTGQVHAEPRRSRSMHIWCVRTTSHRLVKG
jgi:hypothetical protein